MTDNGNGYRSHQHRAACQQLGLKHLFTEPYRPRTNGKAERFIRTLTNGWAYGATFRSSHERRLALHAWHRPSEPIDATWVKSLATIKRVELAVPYSVRFRVGGDRLMIAARRNDVFTGRR